MKAKPEMTSQATVRQSSPRCQIWHGHNRKEGLATCRIEIEYTCALSNQYISLYVHKDRQHRTGSRELDCDNSGYTCQILDPGDNILIGYITHPPFSICHLESDLACRSRTKAKRTAIWRKIHAESSLATIVRITSPLRSTPYKDTGLSHLFLYISLQVFTLQNLTVPQRKKQKEAKRRETSIHIWH